ncbi:MAG: fusion protein [Dysgonamonadaceae bacterium]|jgi:hypothetical protein|nr:fusion protein [Dysgonamonadaceae bacterium]
MAKQFLLGANKEIDTNIQTVEVNQIVCMEGYNYDKYVVYGIDRNKWGTTYKLINLRTKEFDTSDLIRPLSEKFGIGIYYDDVHPQFLDAFEVAILQEEAQANANAEHEAEQREKQRREQVSAIGRKRLSEIIPSDAQAVIIACEREDESDSQADYFSSKTVRTMILGFSTHTKNNFQEMRGYAVNFEETTYLTEKNEDYEYRENYTGGHGYYLGESKYRGWIIEKERIYDREHFIERFAYTAGDEANICIKTTPKTAETNPMAEPITGDYTIVDYSEKSVAIFGDTRAIKEQLSTLGGRFNKFLTLKGKKCAGWIFQKNKEDDLRKLVNLN